MTKKMSEKVSYRIFRRVLNVAKPYPTLLYGSLALALILAPLSAVRPYLVSRMVDDHIVTHDISGLKWMVLLFLGIVLASSFLRYIFILTSAILAQNVVKDLRTKVYSTILRFNLRYFNDTPVGTATTRTINDIEAISTVFQQGVFMILADILGILAVLGVMLYTSWKLTLICLITMPFLIIVTYVFKEKVKKAYQRERTIITQRNAYLQERISGMRIVQLFNAEKDEKERFRKINRDYTQANLDTVNYYATFFPVVELITSAALALMVWLGAMAFLKGQVSFGALIAFPMFLNQLFRPVRMLADKFNQLQRGLIAAERVFSVQDTEANIPNEGTVTTPSLKGNISFEDVQFSYDGENKVLHGVSFDLKSNNTLAIVGSTGSGKSTIINLLCRFYDIQKGSIKIDGVDIKDYDLYRYRKHISVVLQDVFLFNGTVLENITLRDENITREQVIEASKIIGAHRYIMNLPGDYDYNLMERGNNLSAGQRQLISFVRALVFDPDILVLDEATSSIDTETEAVIQHAIETLIEERTSIIIAHRLSTIRHADKIIVLNNGNIIEEGSHSDLLSLENGRYKELYELQFANDTKS